MLRVSIENIADLPVFECEGRVVQSEPISNCEERSPRNKVPESLCWISRKTGISRERKG